MKNELEASIRDWAVEADAVLRSSLRLAEYFGSDDEFRDLTDQLGRPMALVNLLREPFALGPVPEFQLPPKLRVSECVARVVSPLFETLVVPEPAFLYDCRQSLEPETAGSIIHVYGHYLAQFGFYVCRPIWSEHPQFAPDGWS